MGARGLNSSSSTWVVRRLNEGGGPNPGMAMPPALMRSRTEPPEEGGAGELSSPWAEKRLADVALAARGQEKKREEKRTRIRTLFAHGAVRTARFAALES